MKAAQVPMFTAPPRLSLAFTLLLWAPSARAAVTLDERHEQVVQRRGGAPRQTASSITPGVAPQSAQTRRRRLLQVSSSPLRHELPQLDDGGLHKAKPAVPKLPKRWDVCVVGAGLSGGVVAERLASVLDKSVLVIERRRHIAGNCYDYAEEETGLRINLYGPHNFHTNLEDAWKYINKFGRWVHYYHKKLSWSEDLGRFLPMPVNIETINTLYHENLMGEDEVKPFLESVSEPCGAQGCRNSEEQAIASVGKRMYERFFKG